MCVVFIFTNLLLTNNFLKSGYSIAFFVGTLPPRLPIDQLAFILAAFAAAECLGSIILGQLADLIGVRVMVWLTFMLHAIAIVLTFIVFEVNQLWLSYITLIVCGFADSGSNTQIYGVLGIVFKENVNDAFAALKLVQSFASAIGFVKLDYLTSQIMLIVLLSCTVVTFFILDVFIHRVTVQKKSETPAQELVDDQNQDNFTTTFTPLK